jgi:N-methylhydantoinase A
VSVEELNRKMSDLENQGRSEVASQGISESSVRVYPSLDLRYVGQSYELSVPLTGDYLADFHRAHQRAYGHSNPDAPVEIVNLRLRAAGSVGRPAIPSFPIDDPDPSEAFMGLRSVVLPGEKGPSLAKVPFYLGDKLRAGHVVVGPAVLAMRDTTVFLPRADRAAVDGRRNVLIEVG